MKTLLHYLVLFVLISVPYQVIAETKRLKVATWNLQWLNRHNDSGIIKRRGEDYEMLRYHAKVLDADIIAMQEVDGPLAARRIFPDNRYDFYFSDRKHLQRVGFAIKKSINYIKLPSYKALTLESKRLRQGMGILVNFAGQNIHLLAVHLKSGCFDNTLLSSERKACRMLRKQVTVMQTWLHERNTAKQSFIVLGDFNHRFNTENWFWQQLQKRSPALFAPTINRQSICHLGRYPDFIDHILVSGSLTKQLKDVTFRQFSYWSDSPYKLSDHCPIMVILKAKDSTEAAE